MVTPMLPQRHPTNAPPLVTYTELARLAPSHEITLVTIAGADPGDQNAVDDLRALGIDVEVLWRPEPNHMDHWAGRLRLARDWLCSRRPLYPLWFFEPKMQDILDRLLGEKRFDLIQVEDSAVALYCFRTKVPIILMEHEVRCPRPIQWHRQRDESRAHWIFREVNWRRWRRYYSNVWRRFDLIQVFTPRDATAIHSITPALADRVRVNPFGIETPTSADPCDEEHNTIVFVGGFAHLPNVDAALWLGREIMPLLRAYCPCVHLIVVGSYPPHSILSLASSDIIVTGRVPEVEPYLQRAAVVLAPVRSGGGMRMKVLQGMALGKAVVTTSLGAAGLAVEGIELPLIIAEGAEDFARATAMLLNAPDSRRELGARARVYVAEHYSAAAFTRRLEAIYTEVVSPRKVADGSIVRGHVIDGGDLPDA